MGYKRAGFEVIGNVEIDKRINEVYKKNLRPKYNFCMDLRDFNKIENLPAELYHLDILDGSPPCTTFSTAGQREKTWGRLKKFREGQTEQTLDDLFFVWLETVKKLRPKIAIAENVTGLIEGNAKGYVNEIIRGFKAIGYDVQIFRLNAAFMDVPQLRERIFFIANNQGYEPLKLNFNGRLIKFGEVRTAHGKPMRDGKLIQRLKYLLPSDNRISDITMRVEGKPTGFTCPINFDDKVCLTITSGGNLIRACDKSQLSDGDKINVSTFPQDYDFCGGSVQFICGMCVPPNMMANLATEVKSQWL
ncbi:MAG: DNA cytosine methyltransferase [Selenomonadaceae bacterium]|nr:DNA cytosine methyltransferase [Selenomonadaceae bacterium]